MKFLMLLPLLLVSLFSVAAKPVNAATIPAQVVLVFPSGYTPPDYDINLTDEAVDIWTHQVQDWFIQEVGKTFDYTFTIWNAPFTLESLGPVDACGAPGGGGVLDTVLSQAIQAGIVNITGQTALQLVGHRDVFNGKSVTSEALKPLVIQARANGPSTKSVGRVWFVMVGGGGWAGGYYTVDGNDDFGAMLVGDWTLHEKVLQLQHPEWLADQSTWDQHFAHPCAGWIQKRCILWHYDQNGNFACDQEALASERTYGHEITHTMNMDSHNPVIYTGDPMSSPQKRQLLHSNRAFLRNP